ncbi:MAG: transporter [Sphingobacterium composti]
MKKAITILITILVCNTTSILACEICGGGLGNNYTGLLPNFNKRFIGIRYHFNQVKTQLDINGNETALTNHEKYKTAELWSAWNIGTQWRVMAIIPYSNIQKYNTGTDKSAKKSGLGDINLSGYYNLINKSEKFNQNLWLGLGVKLATGQYNKDEFSSTNTTNIYQLGTGSYDFTTSVNYDLSKDNIGINTNVSYKMNTKNSDEYQYGNKLTLNGSVYYNILLKEKYRFRPNIGIQHDTQARDKSMGYKIDHTGGYNTNINIGLESTINNLAVGFTYQEPLSQYVSHGRTELQNKFLIHLTFMF